jgi:hypothetical protein
MGWIRDPERTYPGSGSGVKKPGSRIRNTAYVINSYRRNYIHFCLVTLVEKRHLYGPDRYIKITHDPLLFIIARGIFCFWLASEKLSCSTEHWKEGGEGSLYSRSCSLAIVLSCIDPFVRIVTKSPKVGPLLIFSISPGSDNDLILYYNQDYVSANPTVWQWLSRLSATNPSPSTTGSPSPASYTVRSVPSTSSYR